MKKVLLLAVFMLFTAVTTQTFAADFDVGDNVEKATTLDNVAEQHDVYVALGWETKSVTMQNHEIGNFILFVYDRDGAGFAYASNIVEGLDEQKFNYFVEQRLQIPKPEKAKPTNSKTKTLRVGSSGGLPYTHSKRVAHV